MSRMMIAALLAVSASASAQKPLPKLYLAPDLNIPARQINLAGNGGSNSKGSVFVGPDGRILYSMNYFGDLRYFDSLGRTMPVKVPLGDRDGDIGWIERGGWMGNTFWISDLRFGQVVLLDPNGKITKSFPNPTWIHPHWADRRKYPLFARLNVLAVYPDSTMLVLPYAPRTLLDTPGFDKTLTHLFRVTRDGAVEKHVAALDDDNEGRLVLRGIGSAEHVMQSPVVSRRFWRVSDDGKRIVFVTPGRVASDSGRFRVMMLNENGDTIFNRLYDGPAVRVDRKMVDSVLAQVRGFGEESAEQIRTKLASRIPEYQSFITGLLAGRDHSTWILMRPVSDTAKGHTALVLDERGEPLATVAIPASVTPLVVDRTRLWGTDRTKLGIVRMRVQATPPPPEPAAPNAAPAPIKPASKKK